MATRTRLSTIDLATLGTTDAQSDSTIAFGRTDAATLWRLATGRRGRPKFATGFEGRRQIWSGEISFDVDAGDRFVGLHFGYRDNDALTEDVRIAVSGKDHAGVPIPAPAELDCGNLRLRLFGHPLRAFATLPRLAGIAGSRPGFQLTSRAHDKWLRVSLPLENAALDLEFVLSSFQEPYGDAFHIDYCLYGLSLIHHSTK
ncbi:hypothetical protein SAMN05880582_10151 [Rhizobium sp. RU20A]|uniref:hypothetical protein n=1 Tax=Rhizobium sp. RU20A TaxID=1907412 RepID=UPI000954971F|nr:hypothetical protein [Rhizobium sp. RU20A]SIP92818.1 hypothetical protein SAMN05880582_10151 [Rhizobium sp. RU20A]